MTIWPSNGTNLEAVEIVERLKERGYFGREFETQKASARLQHAARLGERPIDMGDVAQPEADRIEVDAAVGHRKPLGIGAHPFDPGQNSLIERAGAADREHRLADIADDGPALRGPPLGKTRQGAQCDVAGAAGDIEQTLARTRLELATISSFHQRWMPALIKSFIRS